MALHESTRNVIKKELRLLRAAEQDMKEAGEAAEMLDDPSLCGVRALVTGMVVAYARPFVLPSATGVLSEDWKPQDTEALALHEELLRRRSKRYAHSDKNQGRELVERGWIDDRGEPTTIYEEERADLAPELFPRIAELCRAQAKRLREVGDKLERDLQEDDRRRRTS